LLSSLEPAYGVGRGFLSGDAFPRTRAIYKTVRSGTAEFANGVRLVYPMEGRAMRFFNLIGNRFFSAAFSWVLGQRIKDTLCGTKVLSRKHYLQIAANRSYFGDFDPFGDFDLIFSALAAWLPPVPDAPASVEQIEIR
jgi:hypothetical protein